MIVRDKFMIRRRRGVLGMLIGVYGVGIFQGTEFKRQCICQARLFC
jgi:hypothetical protein